MHDAERAAIILAIAKIGDAIRALQGLDDPSTWAWIADLEGALNDLNAALSP